MRGLVVFLGLFGGLGAATYLVPDAEAVQPWVPGEPLPIVHLLDRDSTVQEDLQGDLVVRAVEDPAPAPAFDAVLAIPVAARPGWVSFGSLPPRFRSGGRHEAPAALRSTEEVANRPAELRGRFLSGRSTRLPERDLVDPTFLEVPPGSLDTWFTALERAESGEPGVVARALHWGDSTIAADGITGRVRARLQARFGDGGPGFLPVHVDKRWSYRPGVARWTAGDWESHTITFGGALGDRYGLGGNVSTGEPGARTTLGGLEIDGRRQLIQRFDVFYQVRPGGGVLHMGPRGGSGTSLSTASDTVGDRFSTIIGPARTVTLSVSGGPVAVYGVALETAGPGVTWETLGVAGAGQGSYLRQGPRHLAQQVSWRDPDLLVYMTGGNELTYPSLREEEGAVYRGNHERILARLQAGAPQASCLVVSPLDQAERVRGEVVSKALLGRMVELQRQGAYARGCAFWDARHAMGGEGGFARFLLHEPSLAWSDLSHLTLEGLDIVGDAFADALLLAYDRWKADRSAEIVAR